MAETCGSDVFKHPGALKDVRGNYVGFFINGTDPSVGVVDMAALADDFVADTLSPDGTFRICIETAAAIEVQLSDGTDFTITTAQATAYLGRWYPANIRTVYKTGTTGTFSVGW